MEKDKDVNNVAELGNSRIRGPLEMVNGVSWCVEKVSRTRSFYVLLFYFSLAYRALIFVRCILFYYSE